jgi:hypothetical protein
LGPLQATVTLRRNPPTVFIHPKISSMGCSQMTNSAGHAQPACASSGGVGPTGIGSPMPTGIGSRAGVDCVLNSKSAQGMAGAQKLASGTRPGRLPGRAAAVGSRVPASPALGSGNSVRRRRES